MLRVIVLLLCVVGFGVAAPGSDCDPACATGLECCKKSNTCYDDKKQLCCDGTILDKVGKFPQCCGSVEIDFSHQTCCDGVVYEKGTGLNFCCANVSYDPSSDMCCNKVVVPKGTCNTTVGRVSAPGSKCDPACAAGLQCCKKSNTCYDDNKQLCCNGTILDRVGKIPQCCGSVEIDFSHQTCCDNVVYEKGPGLNFCCANVTFDPSTDECCNKVVVPKGTCSTTVGRVSAPGSKCDPACAAGLQCCEKSNTCYDNNKQLCCNGTILDRVGKIPQCCGSVEIDFSVQTCCDNVVHDKTPGLNWCCGNMTYSPSTDTCCNKTIVPIGSCNTAVGFGVAAPDCDPPCDTGLQCCKKSNTCYDDKKQLCCNGTILDKVGKFPQCCGSIEIDFAHQTCCDGVVYEKGPGLNFCCANVTYDPSAYMCCDKVVVPKGTCNTTTVGRVKAPGSKCDPACAAGLQCCKKSNTCYDDNKQLCCNGTILDRIGKIPQCCGSVQIDFSHQTCCDNVVYEKGPGLNFCCANVTYDPSSDMCCDKVVAPKGTCNTTLVRSIKHLQKECNPTCQSGSKCCQGQCYDEKTELCCVDTVQPKVGTSSKCCLNKAIDIATTICCNGIAQPKKYGVQTTCCGSNVFPSDTHICCENNVVPIGTVCYL